MLPNLALWAVSFVAGTGFSAVEGASATWTGSRTSLLPMVPAFGALPQPGAFPGWLPLVALRAALAGQWLPALRALEGVEFVAGAPDAPDETLIFTPAAAGERQLLRACAKYGDAILFPAR